MLSTDKYLIEQRLAIGTKEELPAIPGRPEVRSCRLLRIPFAASTRVKKSTRSLRGAKELFICDVLPSNAKNA